MFTLLVWAIFGFLIGLSAKFLHPGDDPVGCLPTIGIGWVGYLFGASLNYLLSFGTEAFGHSGFIMSVLGGVAFLALYRWWVLRNSATGPKSFFTGKSIK